MITIIEISDGISKISAKIPDKLEAAVALEKKPASVIPTWIVDNNLVSFSCNFLTRLAFLLPLAINISNFSGLADIIAISLAAKNALINKSITMIIIWEDKSSCAVVFKIINSSVRVSLSRYTTEEELNSFVSAAEKALKTLAKRR